MMRNICAIVLSLAVNAAAANPLDVFLDDLDTFSADFRQVLLDSSGEALESSRGALRLRRPGMFYWFYREPYVQKIISDGANLWIYEADLEQVTISDVSESIEDTPALIFDGDTDLDEYFTIRQLEDQDGSVWVDLIPRNPEPHYRLLRLLFLGDELGGMTLFDNLGQTLLISFENVVRNPELDQALFTFTPTDEMEVIDARQVD